MKNNFKALEFIRQELHRVRIPYTLNIEVKNDEEILEVYFDTSCESIAFIIFETGVTNIHIDISGEDGPTVYYNIPLEDSSIIDFIQRASMSMKDVKDLKGISTHIQLLEKVSAYLVLHNIPYLVTTKCFFARGENCVSEIKGIDIGLAVKIQKKGWCIEIITDSIGVIHVLANKENNDGSIDINCDYEFISFHPLTINTLLEFVRRIYVDEDIKDFESNNIKQELK